MKKLKRIAWLVAIVTTALSPTGAIGASADDKAEAAPLPLNEYQELKRFVEIPSAGRIAQSNLRQQQIIQAALTYSPTAREILASLLAAGQDTAAAKGAKAPQVTATVQSVITEGDLALASKNRGSPGATIQAT